MDTFPENHYSLNNGGRHRNPKQTSKTSANCFLKQIILKLTKKKSENPCFIFKFQC